MPSLINHSGNTLAAGDVIIGLDPGIGITGYGVLRVETDGSLHTIEYGVFKTTLKQPNAFRLQELYDKCVHILTTYKPVLAGCEELFFTKNITTGISVAQARGVLLLALAQHGIRMVELTPPQVKEAVTGYGAAEKAQVQFMTQQILKLEKKPTPDDAADALAVAIAAQQLSRFT